MTKTGHEGLKHWKHQRITAVVNMPLMLWLVWSVVGMQAEGWSYDVFTNWLSAPVNAVLMGMAVLSVFYHAALGLQVVVEDYIHDQKHQKIKLVMIKMFFIAMAVLCLFSIFKIVIEA